MGYMPTNIFSYDFVGNGTVGYFGSENTFNGISYQNANIGYIGMGSGFNNSYSTNYTNRVGFIGSSKIFDDRIGHDAPVGWYKDAIYT